MKASNPFTNAEIAKSYDSWYYTKGLDVAGQEKALLQWLIQWYPNVGSILEIGCGTGYFLRWFDSQGMNAAGVDKSIFMIREAKKKTEPGCILGDATRLPVAAKSYDLVALITSIEFLSEPVLAVKEALRVARKGIILGVLNKNSSLGKRYMRSGGPIWSKAQLYSLAELRRLLESAIETKYKVIYRTTLWPCIHGALPLPWGGFIGMAVILHSTGEEE